MRRGRIKRRLTSMMKRAYGSYRVGSPAKRHSKGGMWNKLTKHARVKAMKMKWKNPRKGLRRKRYYPKSFA